MTEQTLQKVSHSEAETFLSCRRKHFYGYIKNGGLKAKMAGSALTRGSFLHECLEKYYETLLAAGNTSKKQRAAHQAGIAAAMTHYLGRTEGTEGFEHFDDTPASGKRSVHEALFEFYFPNESLVRAGWTVQAVELKIALEMELDDDTIYQYPFVVDMIAIDPDGKTVIIDHKYIYDFYGGGDTDLLSQLPKYLGALRAGGYPADYAAYNMIRNRTKKDAQLEDVVRFLPVKPNAFQIEDVMSEQFSVAANIIDLRAAGEDEAEAMAYRSASAITCGMCDYSDICRTERTGGNISIALSTDFTERDPDKPFEADLVIN